MLIIKNNININLMIIIKIMKKESIYFFSQLKKRILFSTFILLFL